MIKKTLENYLFEKEPVAFYIDGNEDLSGDNCLLGDISVSECGQISGTLFGISKEFLEIIKKSPNREGRYRQIDSLQGLILRTNQSFSLLNLDLVPTYKSIFNSDLERDDWKDHTLGDLNSFWRIGAVKGVVLFDHTPKGTHYVDCSAPVTASFPLKLSEVHWNLDAFPVWLGNFLRPQPDANFTGGIGDINLRYFSSPCHETYCIDGFGSFEIERNHKVGRSPMGEVDAQVTPKGNLGISFVREQTITDTLDLFHYVEWFFRSFVVRDEQLPYPVIKLSNSLEARVIYPRKKMRVHIQRRAEFPNPEFEYNAHFDWIKNNFGYLLAEYIKKAKEEKEEKEGKRRPLYQKAFKIYADDVCDLEISEQAFLSLASGLEHFVRGAFPLAGGVENAEKEREDLKTALEAFFKDSDFSSDLKKYLKGSAGNYNSNPSMVRRFSGLLTDLDLGLPKKEIKAFTKAFWKLRCDLGHEAATFQLNRDGDEFIELFQIISITRMIYCALLMHFIDFPKKLIVHTLRHSGEFSQERNLIRDSSKFSRLFKFLSYQASDKLEELKQEGWEKGQNKELDEYADRLMKIKDGLDEEAVKLPESLCSPSALKVREDWDRFKKKLAQVSKNLAKDSS